MTVYVDLIVSLTFFFAFVRLRTDSSARLNEIATGILRGIAMQGSEVCQYVQYRGAHRYSH